MTNERQSLRDDRDVVAASDSGTPSSTISVDPIPLIRAFFLLAATTILLVASVPALNGRFLVYGSRASTTKVSSSPEGNHSVRLDAKAPVDQSEDIPRTSSPSRSRLQLLLDHLATYRVPHSWFAHFYILSVCSSLFWAYQILAKGRSFAFVAGSCRTQNASSMSLEQLLLTWALMLIQGLRRLYESVTLSKPSESQMWIVHWLLGLAFYAVMGVAVWIEGIPTLQAHGPLLRHLPSLWPSTPSTILALVLFALSSVLQNRAHTHLSTLPRPPNSAYTLPNSPLFRYILCPHYTFEVLIYLSLAILAAPRAIEANDSISVGMRMYPLNITIWTGLLFVAVNLGVTAKGTYEWYVARFGADKVGGRARMVPWIW